MFSQKFKISNQIISNSNKSLIIAEVGINHEGSFSKCIKLIIQANKAGANLIKLQIIDPESSYESNTFSHKIFKKSKLTKEEIFNIYKICKKKNIKIFSTFDKKNFEFFKKINQPCYKISSSLFYDYYFIKDVIKTNKPVIISTGLSDIKDVDVLIDLIKKEKNKKMALLHCISLYPTKKDKLNLSRINYFKSKYNIISGFSDHSLGKEAAVASIHHGAKILEKHFTLDSKRPSYDHHIALEPKNFQTMVKEIRQNEQMIGDYDYKIFNESSDYRKMSKIIRSFKLIRDVKKNCYIKKNDFKLMRTKDSRKISKFSKIINKIVSNKVSKNLKKGTFLSHNDFKKK